jgi:hypothetical protein
MLAQMEKNVQMMQVGVLSKLDEMSARIAILERSLGQVVAVAGIDPAELERQVQEEMRMIDTRVDAAMDAVQDESEDPTDELA